MTNSGVWKKATERSHDGLHQMFVVQMETQKHIPADPTEQSINQINKYTHTYILQKSSKTYEVKPGLSSTAVFKKLPILVSAADPVWGI